MKSRGYMGKILRVNLSARRIEEEELTDAMAEQFIGGCGFGAKILYEETTPLMNPLEPQNPLIFATGPVTGTPMFSSDRFDAVSRSPLTGIFAESSAGGYWAGTFKSCGYDALVITGASASPVYLFIDESGASLLDATHLCMRDTFEKTDMLRAAHGDKTRAAVIGPAGERVIKIANIITDGYHGRVLGRCGLGAVMGSKNLKAVAVNGSKPIPLAHEDRLRELLKKYAPSMREGPALLREGGTSVGLDFCEEIGNLPIRNWSQGIWPEGAKRLTGLTMAKELLIRRYHCNHCIINCGRVVESVEGPYRGREIAGPEYETLALLGANCLIDDLRTIVNANELCNRYGIDTISTGNAVSFAMEAYERGLVTKSDTGGIELTWGNGEALLSTIGSIARGEGIGELLGNGVRRAAEEIGGTAGEFAMHVKGLEPPAHDPRARFTQGLGFATANRGACHLAQFTMDYEEGSVIEDLGSPGLPNRFNTEGKGENVFRMQNLMSLFDSLVCCKFVLFGGITVKPLIEFLNAVTGWEIDHSHFFTIGERIFNVKRLYNVRLGISRKDDTLPPRMLTHRRGGGTNELPLLYTMLNDYYHYRGWDEFGIPTRERLKELGLEHYLQQ